MRKFLTTAIPIAALALFICVMLSSSFFKNSFGKGEEIPKIIDTIIQDVNQDAWEEVSEETDHLDKEWKKMIRRIQFSAERDEINYLNTSIARLRGAILAKDKANALVELKAASHYWKNIGR